MNVGDIVTASILVGGGREVPAQVKVLGFASGRQLVRVEMVDGVSEVGLPVGAQTILGIDRFGGAA